MWAIDYAWSVPAPGAVDTSEWQPSWEVVLSYSPHHTCSTYHARSTYYAHSSYRTCSTYHLTMFAPLSIPLHKGVTPPLTRLTTLLPRYRSYSRCSRTHCGPCVSRARPSNSSILALLAILTRLTRRAIFRRLALPTIRTIRTLRTRRSSRTLRTTPRPILTALTMHTRRSILACLMRIRGHSSPCIPTGCLGSLCVSMPTRSFSRAALGWRPKRSSWHGPPHGH